MKRIIKKMEIVSYATREKKTTTWFYYSLFSFVIELITLTIRISANYMKDSFDISITSVQYSAIHVFARSAQYIYTKDCFHSLIIS